jgi:hypothetical protein
MNIPDLKNAKHSTILQNAVQALQNQCIYNNQWMTSEMLISLLKLPFPLNTTQLQRKITNTFHGIDGHNQHIITRRNRKVGSSPKTYGYLLKDKADSTLYNDGKWYDNLCSTKEDFNRAATKSSGAAGILHVSSELDQRRTKRQRRSTNNNENTTSPSTTNESNTASGTTNETNTLPTTNIENTE